MRVEVKDGVGSVEFYDAKGNSLPGLLLQRRADGISALGSDDSARVIVLRSGGTGPFCAGASFDELTRVSTPEEGREFFSGFSRVIRAPKFMLTRVRGSRRNEPLADDPRVEMVPELSVWTFGLAGL